jgi:hypothetical protein
MPTPNAAESRAYFRHLKSSRRARRLDQPNFRLVQCLPETLRATNRSGGSNERRISASGGLHLQVLGLGDTQDRLITVDDFGRDGMHVWLA